jgi:hypothetical protein
MLLPAKATYELIHNAATCPGVGVLRVTCPLFLVQE